MAHIAVEIDGGVAVFTSGQWHTINEDGTRVPFEMPEDKQLQECYKSLIDHVKQKEFERNIKNMVLGYLDYKDEEVENIQLIIKRIDDGNCELNVGVTQILKPLTNEQQI